MSWRLWSWDHGQEGIWWKGGLWGGQMVPVQQSLEEVAHSQSLHSWKVVATLSMVFWWLWSWDHGREGIWWKGGLWGGQMVPIRSEDRTSVDGQRSSPLPKPPFMEGICYTKHGVLMSLIMRPWPRKLPTKRRIAGWADGSNSVRRLSKSWRDLKEVAHSQSLHSCKVIATVIQARSVDKTCKKDMCRWSYLLGDVGLEHCHAQHATDTTRHHEHMCKLTATHHSMQETSLCQRRLTCTP